MGIEIRLPQITGATEKEQLAQIKSYLYQIAEQLQWALQNVDTSSNSAVVVQEAAKSLYPSGSAGSLGSAGSIQDPLATFAAIKALIIKSADIVDAYYDEISKKLVGEYKALSDFGAFVQKTELAIKANSKSITQNYKNTQTIISTVEGDLTKAKKDIGDEIDGVKTAVTELQTNAYIVTGEVGEDDKGLPVYGIALGQTIKDTTTGKEKYKAFSRFTADRLSFFDNSGYEVAYISNYELHITTVEVLTQLKLGGFLVDTSDGLTVKWGGR